MGFNQNVYVALCTIWYALDGKYDINLIDHNSNCTSLDMIVISLAFGPHVTHSNIITATLRVAVPSHPYVTSYLCNDECFR